MVRKRYKLPPCVKCPFTVRHKCSKKMYEWLCRNLHTCLSMQKTKSQNKLFSHQAEAVEWLESHKRTGIIAFEMGSGKTRIALSTLKTHETCLFVSKKTVCGQIRKDAEALGITFHVLIDDKQALVLGVTFVDYMALAKHVHMLQCDVLVLDEAHDIKRTSKTFRKIMNIRRKASIVLSGTVPNNACLLLEMCGVSATPQTQEQFILRRKLDACADLKLPETHIHDVIVDLCERDKYITMMTALQLSDGKIFARLHDLTEIRAFLSSCKNKIKALVHVINETKHGKIAVFSCFASTMIAIRMEISVAFDVIRGGKHTQADIEKFTKSTTRVCVLNSNTCGHGIDLGFVQTCVIMEPSFNVRNLRQIQARMRRIGQVGECRVYRLIAERSIEVQLGEAYIDKVHTDFENSLK